MKKKDKDNRPREMMRLSIEFADNGIILRGGECEDDVLVALHHATRKESGYGFDVDHSDEYRAIGRSIYNWLIEMAAAEHVDEWITTGAELDIVATLNGRAK
jgi:hypothetical protein